MKNLASDAALADMKRDLAKHLPTTNAPDAPKEEEKAKKRKGKKGND